MTLFRTFFDSATIGRLHDDIVLLLQIFFLIQVFIPSREL